MGKDGLLDSDGPSDYDQSLDDYGVKVEEEAPFLSYFMSDTLWTVKIGVPLVIGGASKMTQQMLISILLGRKSTDLLAAVTVSGIWTGWCDAMVCAGAGQIGTLCSMAFGSGNFFLVGTWLQIGLLWLTVLYPPLAIFRFVTGPMLEMGGVPPRVAELSGIFTAWSAPTVICELYYMAVHTYFVCLGVVTPDAVISIVYIGVATFLVWAGVYYFQMSVVGVALALSIKRILRLATLILYCTWQGYHKKTWGGWNWAEMTHSSRWKVFLPMAVPAMIAGIAETLHWSFGALIAARLGASTSAAYDLILTIYILMQSIVGGICAGIGILMARSLGEGRPTRAYEITKVGVALCYGGLMVTSTMFYFLMPVYANFASYDEAVRVQVHSVRLIGSVAMLLSGGTMLIAEVLVKQGRPQVVFTTMPLFTWFVGLPIGFFSSPILGLNGIIWGNVVAYSLAHLVLCHYLWNSDWPTLSKDARIRSEVEKKKSEKSETEPIEAEK